MSLYLGGRPGPFQPGVPQTLRLALQCSSVGKACMIFGLLLHQSALLAVTLEGN